MSNLLLQVLNMSMTGSLVILFVLAVRLALKKQPKIYSYALWSVVLFRLICPVSLTGPVSVLEVAEPEIQAVSGSASLVTYLPEEGLPQADFVAETLPPRQEPADQPAAKPVITPVHGVSLLWAAGAGGLLLYSVGQYFLLKRRLIGAVALSGNVYLADHIDTAFVVGLIRPRIYLPSQVPQMERPYILAHERHHIHRLDHVTRLLAYLAVCVHWFNPLVWLAFLLSGKDMEMSCDEAVIRRLGPEIRADYSASLLRLTSGRKHLSGMPLAFGEGDTRGRVLNMARWKKPAKWVAAVCAVLCLCVVAVCAFNPEKHKSLEEVTHRTSDQNVATGIGDLFFTYPAGLTSEAREVDNWTREEERLRRRGEMCRNPWDQHFIDSGVDFGGVVGFVLPQSREIRLEELNLPNAWKGLEYTSQSPSHPYAEGEYTLIKDGREYIQLSLYTYSGRGYFIWFYADRGNPAHKQAILNSVEMGGGRQEKAETKYPEPVSLGLLNLTVPKGYGYYRNETVILEISKQDFWKNRSVLCSVTARPAPEISLSDLEAWVEAVGVELHPQQTSYGFQITDEGEYADVFLLREELDDGRRVMAEKHYFYIAGEIVYDVCFDALTVEEQTEKRILESIWLKDPVISPSRNKWVSAAATPVGIGALPEGYNYGFDGDRNIVFAWGNNAVGGVIAYPIPEDVYDPYDSHFFWLEEMGIPDFEDPDLMYTGGMTSGDHGWVAEFASDVPSGTPVTVHRRHSFQVVGNTLYDIWFDLLNISQDNRMAIESVIRLPQAPGPETEESTPEDTAFAMTVAVMEAVSDGSSHITALQESQTGLTERTYLFHEGNYLYTGRTGNGAGVYTGEEGFLIVDEEWFWGEGDGTGQLLWRAEEPEDPPVAWLGNRAWNKTFATYLDTRTDETGICYSFRYDKPFEDSPDQEPYYYADFFFDPQGSFRKVVLRVNENRENGFTITESLHSLDPDAVNAMILREYANVVDNPAG